MANGQRCTCARCRMNGMMGPVVLITLGVLFLINQLSRVSFGELWPIILIVVGLVKILQSTASIEGHIGGPVGPMGPTGTPPGPGPSPNPPLG